MKKIKLEIPVNRVEGDLDIKVEIEDGVIVDAKSVGTLYRGFENILIGRDPMDALVFTPRVCGICSVSHLLAAAKALDEAYNVNPPPQAIRIRNLSILAETMQSDLRQHYLMFMSDFANEYYTDKKFFEDAKRMYEPFKGECTRAVLDITKEILKIIAILGGQWPHTSHIVPGGVVTNICHAELFDIQRYLISVKKWLEKNIYMTDIDEILNIKNYEKLQKYIEKHPTSQVSHFTKIAKETNLFNIGKTGYGYITYGCVDDPHHPKKQFIPAGFSNAKKVFEFSSSKITEDSYYSWYEADGVQPPFEGTTIVNRNKPHAYTWVKAPRYDNNVAQTGPLAEDMVSQNPLFLDLVEKFGDSVYVRQLSRILRPAKFIKYMFQMIEEAIIHSDDLTYISPKKSKNARSVGLSVAARGALGHWLEIKDGKISRYQIISPTTWNGSPKDSNELHGPWEKALLGLKIKDTNNPMELGHVIRSFDPCLVCTVHSLDNKLSYKVGI